jgi:threonine/homoserine/homoserine lactone efflux protein
MAFFPLFLRAESTPVTLLALIVYVTAISFLIQTGLVFFGNATALRLSQWKYACLVFTRLAGVTFIGFGIKLALNNR